MDIEKKTNEEQFLRAANQVTKSEPSEVAENELNNVAGGLLPAVQLK